MIYRDVDPPQVVSVRRDDAWHPGTLEAWRHDGAVWLAYVRYTIDVGVQHLGWVGAERVRR